MKTVPMIATLFAAVVAVSVPSLAAASNYKDICRSTRLSATERKECRAYMKAAENDAQEAGIFRYFDHKIAGLEADPALLPGGAAVQAAKDAK